MRRRLTLAEKESLRRVLRERGIADDPVLDAALEGTEVLDRGPSWREIRGPRSVIAHVALAGQAIGITLGHQVYLRRSEVDVHGGVPLRLLAHELAHVVQYRRDGILPFLVRYLTSYARGRIAGRGHHGAYLAIGYEREARMVEAAVEGVRRLGDGPPE